MMVFSDFLKEIKKLNLREIRSDTENFLECVVEISFSTQLKNSLESYFGPALKPTGEIPTKKAEEIAAPFGGVRQNQTLYYCQRSSLGYATMIWPWGDGVLMTVKIFQL